MGEEESTVVAEEEEGVELLQKDVEGPQTEFHEEEQVDGKVHVPKWVRVMCMERNRASCVQKQPPA